MKECRGFQDLIMRCFDHDLGEGEQASLDDHVRSCEECRTMFSDLGAILATLEEACPQEPAPELERMTLARLATLPAPKRDDGLELSRFVRGTIAGLAALLVLTIGVTLQGMGIADIILAGRHYLDLASGVLTDAQIVYQIASGLFPSEVISWLMEAKLITIASMLIVLFMALRSMMTQTAEAGDGARGSEGSGDG